MVVTGATLWAEPEPPAAPRERPGCTLRPNTTPSAPVVPIFNLPHPRLDNGAGALDAQHIANAQFQRVRDEMVGAMYTAPGIGLDATQVDVDERFMVIDVAEARDQPLVVINPVIRHRTEQLR